MVLELLSAETSFSLHRLPSWIVEASSNDLQGARQGFALALSQVLNAVLSVSGDSLLELINKELDLSASIKGQVRFLCDYLQGASCQQSL